MAEQEKIWQELKEICISTEQNRSEYTSLNSARESALCLEREKTREHDNSSSKVFYLRMRFESIEAVLADLDKKISDQENIIGRAVLQRQQAKMNSEMQSCRTEMERMEALERGRADEVAKLQKERHDAESALIKLNAARAQLEKRALSLLVQLHRLHALP